MKIREKLTRFFFRDDRTKVGEGNVGESKPDSDVLEGGVKQEQGILIGPKRLLRKSRKKNGPYEGAFGWGFGKGAWGEKTFTAKISLNTG